MKWSPRNFEEPKALIQHAVKHQVSDVHITALNQHYRIRCRVHGALHEVAILDTEQGRALVQRIKAACGMNIAESRLPQDGRMSIGMVDMCDVRVAAHPTLHGENLVLRLLSKVQGLCLEKLGFGTQTRQQLIDVLTHKQGMILVAGPTGAGKTTTLHAMLRQLGDDAGNVMTLEDPVELEWDQAVQTDLSRLHKMDFPSGLRSLLRQDPDVILIGEIRDTETARLALQAAMTGHRVFASVHAYDTLGTIARLTDLGLSIHQLLPHISAIVSQRLITVDPPMGSVTAEASKSIRSPVAEVWKTFRLATLQRYNFASLGDVAAALAPDVFWSFDDSLCELRAAQSQASTLQTREAT